MEDSSIIAIVVSIGSLLVNVVTVVVNLLCSLNSEKSKRRLKEGMKSSKFREQILNRSISLANELIIKTSKANIENIINKTVVLQGKSNEIDGEHLNSINEVIDSIKSVQFDLITRLKMIKLADDDVVEAVDNCCDESIKVLEELQNMYCEHRDDYEVLAPNLEAVEVSNAKLMKTTRNKISEFSLFD